MMKHKTLVLALSASILATACGDKTSNTENSESANTASDTFNVQQAKDNLDFATLQYMKLINNLDDESVLKPKPMCIEQPSMVCVPRSEEHNGIFMEQEKKWTNGFFPGVLWKLLASKQYISSWSPDIEQTLLGTATYYQAALFPETKRSSTHDLGFILYDSFGEALMYDELGDALKASYTKALDTGRATLATRYSDKYGLIRSWDWVPNIKIPVQKDGEQVIERYQLADPWQFPVIVDNMMNLEFLLAGSGEKHHKIAFDHAKQTLENHYFYESNDTKQKYPLAYHVFDYDSQRPGNWQGVGNISAWARGQAWSLYGYVTIVEALENARVDITAYPDFEAHLNKLLDSVEYLLQDQPVPYWDFFAAREDAYKYAENVSNETTIYSGILGLCDKRIESYLKPYIGYRPMILDASLLSDDALNNLKGKTNWHGETILQDGKLNLCGSKAYPDTHTTIPKDTSAASIFAAALYRYAQHIQNPQAQQKYVHIADMIMAELSKHYRVDRSKQGRPNSEALGFVLAHATGDMGNASEIDTPIIYGDFYFIEANIRKIEYETGK